MSESKPSTEELLIRVKNLEQENKFLKEIIDDHVELDKREKQLKNKNKELDDREKRLHQRKVEVVLIENEAYLRKKEAKRVQKHFEKLSKMILHRNRKKGKKKG